MIILYFFFLIIVYMVTMPFGVLFTVYMFCSSYFSNNSAADKDNNDQDKVQDLQKVSTLFLLQNNLLLPSQQIRKELKKRKISRIAEFFISLFFIVPAVSSYLPFSLFTMEDIDSEFDGYNFPAFHHFFLGWIAFLLNILLLRRFL